MLCKTYKNHLFILFWNILPVLFRVILSLFFYLILTCPFQRVRFLFLFSLWNINLFINFNNFSFSAKKVKNGFFQVFLEEAHIELLFQELCSSHFKVSLTKGYCPSESFTEEPWQCPPGNSMSRIFAFWLKVKTTRAKSRFCSGRQGISSR